MEPITIIIGGTRIEVPDRAFRVLMTAVNVIVDTGDAFYMFRDTYAHDEISKAAEVSSEIFLALNPPSRPMKKSLPYREVIVESFWLTRTAGHHEPVGIRPIKGQAYPSSQLVECSRQMRDPARYEVGTRFKAWVRPKQKLDSKPHLYCFHGDPIVPIRSSKRMKSSTSSGGKG